MVDRRGATAARLDDAALQALRADDGDARPPALYAHALVRTLDPDVGDLDDADVLVAGGTLLAVGRGLHRSAPPGTVVVDCTGTTLAPCVAPAGPGAAEPVPVLAPGHAATFGIVPGSARGPVEMLVWYPDRAAAVVVAGRVTTGDDATAPAPVPGPGAGRRSVRSAHLGAWRDETGYLLQVLTPDGRYDETRAGRRHAYQGSFWVAGDHVVYRDDLGFWAYGTVRDGTLHHAGYRLHR